VRTSADGQAVELPLARVRCLRLRTPLVPVEGSAQAPPERAPAAAQERDFELRWVAAGQPPLTGRTAGYLQAAEGLYLFVLIDGGRAVQRLFAPRAAYVDCSFGPSVEEVATSRWVADRDELLQALERQAHMPVERLGQSLLALGMITQSQLDRTLAKQPNNLPLGEALVACGAISHADLQTALAHKMGYPIVDLARFEPDPAATRMLTLRMAIESRALPLMIDGQRLIVAVDRPARMVNLQGLTPLKIVPVLASKGDILAALSRLAEHDIWSDSVPVSKGTFPPTVI
jgi:hypothetical protein